MRALATLDLVTQESTSSAKNTQRIHAPKGVPEYFPPESDQVLAIEHHLLEPARLAGYGRIELPIFEETQLYVRGVGESTDVVSKEMYTFLDRGDRSLTLRPEGTAGVIRSIIEHHLDRGALPVKLRYSGPFFRAERPQAGRYRQFTQIGVEAVGSEDPALDAEVIGIADAGYKRVGLTGYELHVTSLGCHTCRPPYRAKLQEFLQGLELDEATRERAQINPLRVLDDKREQVQRQLEDAPLQLDHLCEACATHFAQVRAYLDVADIEYKLAPRLVRGLDYYTRTTFEFVHPQLGAQSGIGGGGRYDGLMGSLGGREHSGIGFGLGLERTLLAARAEGVLPEPEPETEVLLVPIGGVGKAELFALSQQLHTAQIRSQLLFDDRALRAALKQADRLGAAYAVLVGEDEYVAGQVLVRELATGTQHQMRTEDVASWLTAAIIKPSS